MVPPPLSIIKPPRIPKQNSTKFSANNNKPSIILDHPIPNNFLFISVFAVIIYVRSLVNVPVHLLQFKFTKLQQYFLNKTIGVHRHQSIPPIIVVKKSELLIDFLLSTDQFRRYIFKRDIIERQIDLPIFTFFILLFPILFPLTFATKLPSSSNIDLFGYPSTLAFNFSTQKTSWHVGCCLQSNQSMCDSLSTSSLSNHRLYLPNDTSSRTFLFDDTSQFFTHRRLFNSNVYSNTYDFLNNQTLFCQRYEIFRNLSHPHLTIFTSIIVIIGIIFNSFVFLVLMRGSLRRSTSFTLFVALTCFDLLSLASSLFSLLFRTVMTYLKTSAPFCKMFGIFFLYFRQCSSTTLLLIAIERCIVIKYPLCRYLFDKLRLPLLATIMLIYVIPIPFDFIFYTSGTLHCEAFDTINAHRYQIFRGFFTVFTYALIPFVGISISNLLIIIELKNSKKRFITKDEDGTTRQFTNNSIDKRGTTVMLFVASFAFLLLLGPYYIHWCITYLFYDYPPCRFTRNLYENVQVCMGVFNPHLTVIEKGMRDSNHAINFLLYMATSKRFRSDFQSICRRLFYRIFGSAILFLCKHICFCCKEPPCLLTLQRHISDTIDLDTTFDTSRKNQAAYKTAHYYNNFERRRQNQLLKATLLNNNTTVTGVSLSPATSFNVIPTYTAKTVRTLTWNPYDPTTRQTDSKRQAARLSQHFSTSGVI